MQINNVNLEIKLFDSEFVKKYEQAFQQLGSRETEAAQQSDLSGAIQFMIGAYREAIDTIYGAGTYDSLGLSKTDYLENRRFMDQYIAEAKKETTALQSEMRRYAPNRAQRRSRT